MAQPLFFLPDLRSAAAEGIPLRKLMLKERGLADVFADVSYDEMPITELPGRGPDNRAGCILAYQTADGHVPRRLGYYPDEQSWHPVGDGSQVWIGLDTAEPPKPHELKRKTTVPGFIMTLGDGNDWSVPVVRRHDSSTNLPSFFKWRGDGSVSEVVKPDYIALFESWQQVVALFHDNDKRNAERNIAQELEWATRAIGLNYRFHRELQNLLGVIDKATLPAILAVSIDLATVTNHAGNAA